MYSRAIRCLASAHPTIRGAPVPGNRRPLRFQLPARFTSTSPASDATSESTPAVQGSGGHKSEDALSSTAGAVLTEVSQPAEAHPARREHPTAPTGGSATQPIPALPPKVSGYPTPWIVQEEVEAFLIPLYSRGWSLRSKIIGKPKSDRSAGVPPPTNTHYLHMQYRFKNYAAAVDFFKDVVNLANTDKHHPSIAIENEKNTRVVISIQTDSAKRPLLDAETDETTDRNVPGLTARDLRLAILIEKQYTDVYVADGRGVDTARFLTVPNLRPLWDRLLTTWRKRYSTAPIVPSTGSRTIRLRRCPACGGQHFLSKCTERANIAPLAPCRFCKGSHWMIDCPTPQKDRQVHKCQQCGGSHITESCDRQQTRNRPCKNCGGPHHTVDCRQPQVPPRIAREMMLPVPELKTRITGKVVAIGVQD